MLNCTAFVFRLPQQGIDIAVQQFFVEGRFASEIVRWQASHGRSTLPWQATREPYRIWLSEIMLQQTQVSTVVPYYNKFLLRFPTVEALANADEDEVLGLWSGLGYYSRARNLFRCAGEVVRRHRARFPTTAAELQTLPGIGRSTAAAIAAFCFGERVAILDANVKRVLSRVLGFRGDLARKSCENELWDHANALLPRASLQNLVGPYTQGVMDLGATVCTPRRPACPVCPVQAICEAHTRGEPEAYPVKSRTLKRSLQKLSLIWIDTGDGLLWLEKRPSSGIWGGLHCLPVFETDEHLRSALPAAWRAQLKPLPGFLHVLTHKDLRITPWRVRLKNAPENRAMPPAFGLSGAWHSAGEWQVLGLPAPIRRLLESERTG